MIHFNKHTLHNGLKIIVHEDNSTPMAVVNIMYNVGARDEDPQKTGFAHLFEHLMFGGSINIPEYDEPLQKAGGDNNAYTTNDLTNYYCVLPAQNIETAFWLESDRMLSLAFNKKSLNVQRKVVCEEFKEHYINKPYGDIWHNMRNLAFDVHPYKWMTIGKELSHIENATIEDVKAFFFKHYRPNNAIVVVAGNVQSNQIFQLVEKWFGNIPSSENSIKNIPKEPQQNNAKFLELQANVPLDAIIKTWHIDARLTKGYYAADLITEIFGGGASSRLYNSLVKNKKLFSSINCYHFGSIDPGLLTIEGKLIKGIKMQEAENAIEEELEKLKSTLIENNELQKVKNRTESMITFEDISVESRANSLAMYELLGDAAWMNTELEKYQEITIHDIQQYAQTIFNTKNSSTIHYYSKNN
ncbi:MAG TPA: pitrilysin family protein [Chitinophagaceae bacterium]|nr:insulinase family protein [Chitinophagaceae bacterium]HMZ47137.1 pitrilysin family protein [Chitinophagaceae bacterium]HNE92980.1 pitrilysin family protein [Chitinophagaceae bacterium]HNF28676.1 pitrilysin family protein [Chitinophagaceae bacterium]HNJ58734.1 pitrilysin family protein [Chitinophagaceae bacterium]